MRVLHVITGLGTGGAEMMLFKLLSARSGAFNHIVLSLENEGVLGPRILALGVPIHSLGLRRSMPNPMAALSIKGIMRRVRPQLIQGWMPHGNLMASLAGVFSQERVPVVWNVRMSLDNVRAEPWLTASVIRLGALLSRRPAAIIYNSQTGARQHEAFGYHAAKRVVIPNGFDCQAFRPDDEARQQVRVELGMGTNAVLIGLIGRYHPMKDHVGFLRAAAMVARTHPQVRFLLAGIGVTREEPLLHRLITEEQLQDRTLLLGERTDIPRLTAALDIACSASAWGEGFSNAVGEAMACGVPCVVTDIGDSAHIVADTGLSVPPRDPLALAQAINRLVAAGPERRHRLGEAARRRVESEFSLAEVVRRYQALYREQVVHRQ